jgi:methionyl-tRNA formyltransferase
VIPADTRITFMGSPEFAVPTLNALVAVGYDVVQVVTQPDRRSGRGGRVRFNPVKAAAVGYGLSVFQPESFKTPESLEALRAVRPSVMVVAAYGKILPRTVLDLPERGILNVHASLLPRWRGPSPIVAAILNGDSETGVSIMEIEPKMDTGPVVSQQKIAIDSEVTAGELEQRLAQLGADELVAALPGWLEGSKPARPQDESLATYCSLLKKEDGLLTRSMTARHAARAVRAFHPWPGAFVTYAGERLAIWCARVEEASLDVLTGTLTIVGREPAIAFEGGLLVLEEVQRPGSRRVSGGAFLNGLRGDIEPSVGLGP